MSRKNAKVFPSPDDSFRSDASSSERSGRSSANAYGANYHESLSYRGVYIERQDPPQDLLRRTHEIISRPRSSPEIDEEFARELDRMAQRLYYEAEDVIAKQLGPHILPAIEELPSRKLTMNANQQWFDSVPLPLHHHMLSTPLPLPLPKPDVAFGFSKESFSHGQLDTLNLLVDDKLGRNYAVPDHKVCFPFLDVEFKSQAKGGTHFVGTNQATGAGAIALNGNLELLRRSFGEACFDFEEPAFFSVIVDHEMARINIHWVSKVSDNDQCSFHVKAIAKYLLDANGIRLIRRAIKNILDYGVEVRLQKHCDALDLYREKVISERGGKLVAGIQQSSSNHQNANTLQQQT